MIVKLECGMAQVMAVSSAGAVFATMRDVPPLSLASWRLQLTTLLLLPGCIFNYCSLPAGSVRKAGLKLSLVKQPSGNVYLKLL